MKFPPAPHPWLVSPKRAIAIQLRLASRVRQSKPLRALRFIAGLDSAFSRDGKYCVAAVVLWDRRRRRVTEQHLAVRPVRFPYVPGLLSFREAPALLAALRQLGRAPDGILCDGHGVAHPRRFGIASHIGFICNLPTVGCAKSLLIGEHDEPGWLRGSKCALTVDGEVLGSVLRTRSGVKPVYVSVGHKVDLPTAERVVLACAVAYRLPEPTRTADRLVARAKRELDL
jgi:deoxyribonuclease V